MMTVKPSVLISMILMCILAVFPSLVLSKSVETQASSAYIGFESGAVRPIARSHDGTWAYVTNTPNHSLEVFRYNADHTLSHIYSIPVGMEPVAVAVHENGDVWVVNHLSDSISIVDTGVEIPFVKRTLLVGDEPRDIVFAKRKAFITTAHRGQHRSHPSLQGVEGAGDPQLHVAGIPRADVWVFDADQLGDAVGGRPLKILALFGDTPRGLAVSPDQQWVYAAVLNSGNQTSVVHESVLCYGFDDDWWSSPCPVMDGISSPNGLYHAQLPRGRTGPGTNIDGVPQPWTSMIVQYDRDSGQWRDSKGRNYSNGIRFNLPDKDVFAVNTTSLQPAAAYRHVGTTLFNLAVNPVSGMLYVSNTEANNSTRFEGSGLYGGSTVQGHIARSRISVINPVSGQVSPRPLNRHIDYSVLKASAETRRHSIATPTQIAVSRDGAYLYVAALGSDKIAVYTTDELENPNFWDGHGQEFDPIRPSVQPIAVSGGPAGLLLNEARDQLLVYTRFDNSLAVIDTNTGEELQRLAMANPEPPQVQAGRRMLYDAQLTSSNGEASCASCHIFADSDQLSWNLGNPDASNTVNPQPFPTFKFSQLGCDFVGVNDDSCQLLNFINGDGNRRTLASMKGPMFTQTLRGISTHGHMHWRGDRANGYFGDDIAQTLNERTSFKNFIVAFEGLLGMDIDLPVSVKATNKSARVRRLEADMERFADFALSIQMPPNPLRGLDNSLSPSARIGRAFFHGERRADGLANDNDFNGPEVDGVNCAGCHVLDAAKGFFGSRGEVAHGGEIQVFKTPQLRNLYTRVGMFGLPDREGFLPSHTRQHQGDQIRGFGFLHDGATDQLLNFLKGGVFDNGEMPCPKGLTNAHGCETNQGRIGIPDERTRQELVDYMMEFESDLAPIVGQQITLSIHANNEAVNKRLELLEQRAATSFVSYILGGQTRECDLLAQGIIDGQHRVFLYKPELQAYQSERPEQTTIASRALRHQATEPGNALTFTCRIPGSVN